MLNMRFTKLTVMEAAPDKINVWKCLCDCGKTRIVQASRLECGEAKSCGCLQRKKQYPSLIGQQFGKLTVIENAKSKRNAPAWLCSCECGGSIILETSQLIKGNNTTCGCLRKKTPNLVGQVFGKLTVLKKDGSKWVCQCSCGSITKPITAQGLKTTVRSCGCYRKEYWQAYRANKGKDPNKSIQPELHRIRDIDTKLYSQVLVRDNNACVLCQTREMLKIHHIIPINIKMGPTDINGLITLCDGCHKLCHTSNWKDVNIKLQHILQHYIGVYYDLESIRDL